MSPDDVQGVAAAAGRTHREAMTSPPSTSKTDLLMQVEAALGDRASGVDIVELVIRCGWLPRLPPEPDSDYLEGVLADGTTVPVQIRHARRAG